MSVVTLRAFAELPDGEQLMMCGDAEVVGTWNPAAGKLLKQTGDNKYEVSFEGAGYTSIHYKYCVRSSNNGNFVKWENGSNRVCRVDSVNEDRAFEHGGGIWFPCEFNDELLQEEETDVEEEYDGNEKARENMTMSPVSSEEHPVHVEDRFQLDKAVEEDRKAKDDRKAIFTKKKPTWAMHMEDMATPRAVTSLCRRTPWWKRLVIGTIITTTTLVLTRTRR